MSKTIQVTCECAPNIALIKYWGKADQHLILPLNGSLSITLDSNVLSSKTTLILLEPTANEKASKKIQIWFDGMKQEFNEDDSAEESAKQKQLINKKRFLTMLEKVRMFSGLEDAGKYHIRIKTTNSFPTACGLASSASGFACMSLCLANAFDYSGDISELARLGSGSACRSCSGGFVEWVASDRSEKSIARSLFPSQHWPELNILALVLEDERKKISSTHGMQTSVQTSEFLAHRVRLVEEQRLQKMRLAINDRDFTRVGKLAIQESNSFHAVCLDTYPPLFYLNEKSKEIIRMVNLFNEFENGGCDERLKAFYSFDAGPNAFLFVLDEHRSELLYLIFKFYFGFFNEEQFGDMVKVKTGGNFSIGDLSEDRKNILDNYFMTLIHLKSTDSERVVKYIIESKVGDSPNVLVGDWSASLLDRDGRPF